MNSSFNSNEVLDTFKVPMIPKDSFNLMDSNSPQNPARANNYVENSQPKPAFQQILNSSQQISQQSPQPGFVAPQMSNINSQQQALEHFVVEEYKALRKQCFDAEREQQVRIFFWEKYFLFRCLRRN